MQKNLDLISELIRAQVELQLAGGQTIYGGAGLDAAREKFLNARSAVLAAMKSEDSIYASLSDEEAQAAGVEIAHDFNLKRSREHRDRFETDGGTFTTIGIARRALRMIESARERYAKK